MVIGGRVGEQGLALYRKYHVDRNDERLGMFALLRKWFGIERALYPGSFVHVTPSFVFPEVCYVDSEQRAAFFFASQDVAGLVDERKTYAQKAAFRFHHQNYTAAIPEEDSYFDVLISQYAGFVSQHGYRYLRIGGWLLANNSHGDASLAFLDDRYDLTAVIHRRGEKFRLSEVNLNHYFVPKKDISHTSEYVREIGRGIGYTKSASVYLFQRVH